MCPDKVKLLLHVCCIGYPCDPLQLPQTPDHLKTPSAQEAFNPNGLSQRTIRLLKDAFPDVEVRCYICYDHSSINTAQLFVVQSKLNVSIDTPSGCSSMHCS
jgi:delta-aminolevulinic acid dehydratase/porphobilinogen synthase